MRFLKWLIGEIVQIFPITLFFFVGFGLILLIVKLVLRDYSVQVGVLSRAMLRSLVAGKVVILLENVHLDERFPNWPRSTLIELKTGFYSTGAVIAGIIEKIYRTLAILGWTGLGNPRGLAEFEWQPVLRDGAFRDLVVRDVFHFCRARPGDGQGRDLRAAL
jgi:hypothetical protein